MITGVSTDTYDYTYDSAGRLTQVDKNSTTVGTYSYDDNNNRTGGTIAGVSTAGTYDNQDRMTDFNMYDYTYDANGDLLTKTDTSSSAVTSYTYDVFGNLRSVTLPNADVITYEIDPRQRRIGKKLNGTLVRRYAYSDQLRIVGELPKSSITENTASSSAQGIAGGGGRVGRITGYTRHGLNRSIGGGTGSEAGRSVSPRSLLDTVRNPKSTAPNPGGGTIYNGATSRVILNPQGQVITTNPTSGLGLRCPAE